MKKDFVKYKKTILIDLDGVLNQYDGHFDANNIPPVRVGVKEFFEKFNYDDFEFKLFTTRNKILAVKWLIENNIDKYFIDVTNTKDLCYLYIDDRCIRFDGDYIKLKDEIQNFKVWYKN